MTSGGTLDESSERGRSRSRGGAYPDVVDQAAMESFPASDPPGWTTLHIGSAGSHPVSPAGDLIADNGEARRFEVHIGDDVAVSGYRIEGDVITFTGTEVPETLRGRGLGEALARAGLESARARNQKVIAVCPFVAAFIRKHPEYQDLLIRPK